MARDSWLKRLIWLRGSPAGGGGASYKKTVGPAPIISISDAKAKAAKSLIVGMEPIQDLHGYDSPWPAGGGKNILPDISRNSSGYNVSVSFNGNTATLTGLANSSGGRNVFRSDYFSLLAGTYYFKTYSNSSVKPSVYLQNDTSIVSADSDGMFTLNADSEKMNIGLNVTSGTDYNYTGTYLISKENVSEYSPYSNECPITGRTEANIYRYAEYDADAHPTYTIQLGQTVYGGTVDLVSGVLTVTHGTETYVGAESEDWSISSVSGLYRAQIRPSGIINIFGFNRPIVLANIGKPEANSAVGNIMQYQNRVWYFPPTSVTTVAELKTWLASNNLQIVFQLETPQTYQLTPTQIQLLRGANVLWSDADELTLTYLGTTPPNLLGGMLGGGFGGGYNSPAEQDPEELTEPEATETDEPAKETPAEEGENNGE